ACSHSYTRSGRSQAASLSPFSGGASAVYEVGGLLCGLIVVLSIVTLLGHGIWVLLAALGRAIFGAPPAEPRPAAPDHDELRDILGTRRQLERLLERGILDRETYELIQARLAESYRKPIQPKERPRLTPVELPRVEPLRAPEEPILDALPVNEPSVP